MKKLLLMTLFAVSCVMAQTATFTFGPGSTPTYPYPQQVCSYMLSWNGVPNAYPNDMGGICFAIYPYGWTNIYIPQELGFPNNGFLTECQTAPTTLGVGTPGFHDNGDGTGSQPFTANGCYDGGNTTISAVIQWKRLSHLSCGHGHCQVYYFWVVNGGEGTVSNQ